MDATAAKLAARVRQSRFFIGRNAADAKLRRLFELFVSKHPGGPTPEEVRSIVVGDPIGRLNKLLDKCIMSDRSFWPGQTRLFIGRGPEKGIDILQFGPFSKSKSMTPTLKLWFSQCARLPNNQDSEDEAAQTFIVLSEPLFFFSKSLRGYIRLLDVNYDGVFDTNNVEKLVNEAKENMLKAVPRSSSNAAVTKFIKNLELEPVRAYVPAGDSRGSRRIRRLFRTTPFIKQEIPYKEVSHISDDEFSRSNLIILASRSSNPLLSRFQRNTPLKIRLTETGIALGGNVLKDESDGQGFHLARVVVTNWTFGTENVHTYIASNHTRALGAVARLLVDDVGLKSISDALVDNAGMIPRKFQLAFNVELQLNETFANTPQLLLDLNGKPIIYPEPKGMATR